MFYLDFGCWWLGILVGNPLGTHPRATDARLLETQKLNSWENMTSPGDFARPRKRWYRVAFFSAKWTTIAMPLRSMGPAKHAVDRRVLLFPVGRSHRVPPRQRERVREN